MLLIRIAMVLALIPAGLLWRAVVVRPVYAGAPLAPRRISVAHVRAKQAASRSWLAMGIAVALLSAFAAGAFYLAYDQGDRVFAVPGAFLTLLVLINVRLIVTKLRLSRG
jgi:hypothetical protein